MMSIPVLVLLLAETSSLASTSCPASCIVCSEDAIICHKLSSIIGVPNTTRALMLTDGWIDLVDDTMLSHIGNISVLGLSNNAISTINENAFQNLIELKTLLLDHNHISSQTLNSSTFSWLPKLKSLLLGNNAIQEIDGYWFKNSKELKILQLEGNLLSTLNSSTFSLSTLSSLETLDLSDNFITHVGRDSFRKLPQLRTLDLSRNRLENIPDAFSYLSWLSMLNLDFNRWNCSCELRELASFLNSYLQAPDKVLYNGQRMMCVSADNPAVNIVLDLTDTNCVPPNRNITVNVETRSGITAQQYTRDIALASILFFAGGVSVTLAVMCIVHHKLVMRKGLRPLQKGSEIDDLKHSSLESVHWNFTEEKEALSQAHNAKQLYFSCAKHKHQPAWDQEMLALPNRVNQMEPHFTCQSCRSAALLIPGMRHGESLSSEKILHLSQAQNQAEPAYQWPVSDERSHTRSMLRDLLLHRQIQKQPVGRNGKIQNPDIMYRGNPRQDTSVGQDRHLSNQSNLSSKGLADTTVRSHGHHLNVPPHPPISCIHCHRKYEYKQAWNKSHSTEEFRAMLQKETLNYNQSGCPRQAKEHGMKPTLHRNVTFDLTESAMRTIDVHKVKYCRKIPKYYHKLSLSQVSATSMKANVFQRDQSKSHRCKIHTKRSLKVKFNLNPLRKGKVNPNTSPRHNKDNPKNIKKAHKHKLKGKVSRDKGDVEQQSPRNMSKKGRQCEDSKDSTKTSSKKTSQLDVGNGNRDDTEGTVCTFDNKKQEDHLQEPDPAGNLQIEDSNEALSKSSETVIQQGISPDQTDLQANVSSSEVLNGGAGLVLAEGIATGGDERESIPSSSNQLPSSQLHLVSATLNEEIQSIGNSISPGKSKAPAVVQEYLYSPEGSPKRKIRLIMPEKTTNRPTSSLDKKIR